MNRSPKDFSIVKNFRFNRVQINAILENADVNCNQTQICMCVKIGDEHVVKIFEVVHLLEKKTKTFPTPLKSVAISLGNEVQKISVMSADLNETIFLIWSQTTFIIIGSDKDVFQKRFDVELVSACLSPDGSKCVAALISSTIFIFDLKSRCEEKLCILQNVFPNTFSFFKVVCMSWENPKRLFLVYHHLKNETNNLIILEDFEQNGQTYISYDFCFKPPSFESPVTGVITALKNRLMRVITTNTSTGVFCVHKDENSVWTVTGISDTGCVSLPVEEKSGADTFSINSTFHYGLFYSSLIPDLCQFSSKLIFAILTTSDVLCLYFVESDNKMLLQNSNLLANLPCHNLETSNVIEFLQFDDPKSVQIVNDQKFLFPISPIPYQFSSDATSTEDLNSFDKIKKSLQLQDNNIFSFSKENIKKAAHKSSSIVESACRIFTDEIMEINSIINNLTRFDKTYDQKYPDITMNLKKLKEESYKLFDDHRNILSLKMTLNESAENIIKIIHDLQCSTVEMGYFIEAVRAGRESTKSIENSLKDKIKEFPTLVINMLHICRKSLVFLENFNANSHISSRIHSNTSIKGPINLGLLQKILRTHIVLINNLQFKLVRLETECLYTPTWQYSPSCLADSLNSLNLKCVPIPVIVFPTICNEKIKERKFKDIVYKLSSHRDVKMIKFKTFSSCIKVMKNEDINDKSLAQSHHPIPNFKNTKPNTSFSTVQFQKSIQQIDERHSSSKLCGSLMSTKLEGPSNQQNDYETKITSHSVLTSPKTETILNTKPEIAVLPISSKSKSSVNTIVQEIQGSQLITSTSVTASTSLNLSPFSITSGIDASKFNVNISNSDFSRLIIPSNLKLESFNPLQNTSGSSVNPVCVSISDPSISASISNLNNISSSSLFPHVPRSESLQTADDPMYSNSNQQSPSSNVNISSSNQSSLSITFPPQSHFPSITLPTAKKSTPVFAQETSSQPQKVLFGHSKLSPQFQSAKDSHFELSPFSQYNNNNNGQPPTLVKPFSVQLPQQSSFNLLTPFSESNKSFGSTQKCNTSFSTTSMLGSNTDSFGSPKPSFGASTPSFGSSVAPTFSGEFNLSTSSIFAKCASSSQTRSNPSIQSSSLPSSISSSTFPSIQNKSHINFDKTQMADSQHSTKFTTWRESKS